MSPQSASAVNGFIVLFASLVDTGSTAWVCRRFQKQIDALDQKSKAVVYLLAGEKKETVRLRASSLSEEEWKEAVAIYGEVKRRGQSHREECDDLIRNSRYGGVSARFGYLASSLA